MAFHSVGEADSLWAREMRGVVVEGEAVLLVRLDETLYAYRDRCLHLAFPLSQGRLEGCVLTCAAHEWQYDVCTGRGINPDTVQLVRYPVKIESGRIWVDVAGRL